MSELKGLQKRSKSGVQLMIEKDQETQSVHILLGVKGHQFKADFSQEELRHIITYLQHLENEPRTINYDTLMIEQVFERMRGKTEMSFIKNAIDQLEPVFVQCLAEIQEEQAHG